MYERYVRRVTAVRYWALAQKQALNECSLCGLDLPRLQCERLQLCPNVC